MATSFQQQPRDPYQIQQQSAYYRQSQTQNYTPPSSVTPPNSKLSPTLVSNPPKQIYAQRSCGYVPAALRPTVAASRPMRPDTPPRSAQSSFESQSPPSQSRVSNSSLPVSPAEDISSFMAPFSQVARVVSDEWNEELGEVTGQPTRGHWKPDTSTTCCTSPTCGTVFSLLARRHHCRRCGGIFCFAHSSRNVPLDQEARFHPQGALGRACDNCHADYRIWQSERKSRASSINSSGTATPPAHGIGQEIRGSDFLGIEPRKQFRSNLANQESVSDWNWSTF